jgi:hypothetical protein
MGNTKSKQWQKRTELAEAWNKARFEPRRIDADVRVSGIGQRRLQIVYAPSFDPGFSWDIREQPGDRELVLYRSRINFVDGHTELQGYHQLDLPSKTLETYLTKLLSLRLSLDAQGGAWGLDGTTYQLALFDAFTSVRFKWWENPPAQWKPMADVTIEMIEKFQAAREKPVDSDLEDKG